MKFLCLSLSLSLHLFVLSLSTYLSVPDEDCESVDTSLYHSSLEEDERVSECEEDVVWSNVTDKAWVYCDTVEVCSRVLPISHHFLPFEQPKYMNTA